MSNFPKRHIAQRILHVEQICDTSSPYHIGHRCFIVASILRDQPCYRPVTVVAAGKSFQDTEERAFDRLNKVYIAAKAVCAIQCLLKAGNRKDAMKVAHGCADALGEPLTEALLARWLVQTKQLLDDPAQCLRRHNLRVRADVAAGVV